MRRGVGESHKYSVVCGGPKHDFTSDTDVFKAWHCRRDSFAYSLVFYYKLKKNYN